MIQELISSVKTYTKEEAIYKTNVVEKFLTSFSKLLTFQTSSIVDMPLRKSIAIIEANVKQTRMRHGTTCVVEEDEERSGSQPLSKRPTHVLVAHSKQKKNCLSYGFSGTIQQMQGQYISRKKR